MEEFQGVTSPGLDHLYIATTAKRDAPLQAAVRELSRSRRANGNFKVDILFWDDVCGDLAGDEGSFFKHYPQFRPGADPAKEHDQKLYDELTALLRTDGVIGFVDRSNMAFPFREEALEPLREFYYGWSAPEQEFISPDLDSLRAALWTSADEYLELVASETWPISNPTFHSVPREWEVEQPERFQRVVTELHRSAREIVRLHGEIVRVGRSALLGQHRAAK